MDVQLPPAAPAGIFSSTNSQSTPRLGQEGIRRDANESGKSFSSELRTARASKEPRQAISRNRTDQKDSTEQSEERDASLSSDDESVSASPTPHPSCAKGEDDSCPNISEPAPKKADTGADSATHDVATQSVLLALIAQPVVIAVTPVASQTASATPADTSTESVMPLVKEDGTSLPVTAADSSISHPEDADTSSPQPADATAGTGLTAIAPPVAAVTTSPAAGSQEAPVSGSAPQSIQDLARADVQNTPAFPAEQKEPSHDPVKVEATPQPVARQNEQPLVSSDVHEAVKTVKAETLQRPEVSQPSAVERPVVQQNIPEPKHDPAPRELSANLAAWQGSDGHDPESGTDWTGQDHRERPASEQALARAVMPESSVSSPPSTPPVPAPTMDQRTFSPVLPAKLPAETQPAARVAVPSVHPTDWMPGTATSQTKSMVLELAQEDLGRVNIRVAVNQDVVHTHFASDRSDMGQYLQSGQDKLQSALQLSGLDLGRFHVDIDRQSSGRSFQDQTSQGQQNGRMFQQETQGQQQEHDESNQRATPRRGMLNLVA